MKYVLSVIFLLTVNVVNAQTKIFSVTDYGANANDNNDDRVSIEKAINSAHNWLQGQSSRARAVIYFPNASNAYLIKSYITDPSGAYLNNYALRIWPHIWFKGQSRNFSIIKFGEHLFDDTDKNTNANMFYGKNDSSVHFNNLTIEMNGKNNLVPADCKYVKDEMAIKIDGGYDVTINNISVKNNSGRNDIAINAPGSLLTIKNSTFLNGGWNTGDNSPQYINAHQTDFSFLYSEWSNTIIQHDSMVQQYPDIALQGATGGIEIHGSNSTIANDYIYGCFPAIFIASALSTGIKYTLQNVVVKDTKMIECSKGIIFDVTNFINSVTIKNNVIQITYPRGNRMPFSFVPDGIEIAGGNLPHLSQYNKVNGNADSLNNIFITDNTITSDVPDTSHSFLTAGMRIHSLKNSIVSNNTIKNMSHAGIELQGSAWGMGNVTVSSNIISDMYRDNNKLDAPDFIINRDAYQPGDDNNNLSRKQTHTNITITGNTFIPNSVSNSYHKH